MRSAVYKYYKLPYFQGKRELFHGLAIEELEEEWTVRPVLHLSLNAEKYDSVDVLRNLLETQLGVWEELYGSKARANPSLSVRFMSVIRRACEVSGQRVAVLIDEYDKPLLRNFHDTKLQDEFRELLTAFYTVLKPFCCNWYGREVTTPGKSVRFLKDRPNTTCYTAFNLHL